MVVVVVVVIVTKLDRWSLSLAVTLSTQSFVNVTVFVLVADSVRAEYAGGGTTTGASVAATLFLSRRLRVNHN